MVKVVERGPLDEATSSHFPMTAKEALLKTFKLPILSFQPYRFLSEHKSTERGPARVMEFLLNHLPCQALIVKPSGIMIEEAASGLPAASTPLA